MPSPSFCPGVETALSHIGIPRNPDIPGSPVIPGNPVFDGSPQAAIIHEIFGVSEITVDLIGVAGHDLLTA